MGSYRLKRLESVIIMVETWQQAVRRLEQKPRVSICSPNTRQGMV